MLVSGLSEAAVAREVGRLVGERVSPEDVRLWYRAEAGQASIPLGYAAALMAVLDDGSIAGAAKVFGNPEQGVKVPLKIRKQQGGCGAAPVSERPEPHLVRAWMSANRITTNDVAEDLEVTPVAVRRWMLGSMTSAKVRQWYLDRGCPVRFVGEARSGKKE